MVLTHVISGGGGSGGGGVPSGPAGGDLSGAYPDPDVLNDSHNHTGATISGDLTLTRVDVDNLRLDGNTVSATDANGNVLLVPAGTGRVGIGGSTSSFPALFPASGALDIRKADNSGMAPVVADAFFTVDTVGGAGRWKVTAAGDMVLRSSGTIKASNTADTNGTPDVGMKRSDVAVWLDTDGSSGIGFRLTGRPVEASTAGSGAPNVLAATESRKLVTNEGAAAEAYNELPASAPVGYEQPFYCQDGNGIRIVAPTGCTIRLSPTQVSAAAGFVRSVVVGSGATLTKINATEFVAVSAPNGTWTVDS